MKMLVKSAVAFLIVTGVASPILAANAPATNDQNATTTKGDQTSASNSKAGSAVTEPKSESEKMNGDSAAPAK